jgi:transcriptional regulator with PAS, ATPase and Fis domain
MTNPHKLGAKLPGSLLNMNDIPEMLHKNTFTYGLLKALPYGLIVTDEAGAVHAINNVTNLLFGESDQRISKNGSIGDLFGCVYSMRDGIGCGMKSDCKPCELRQLALSSISRNAPQKLLTTLSVKIDQQVRDVGLRLLAIPYRHNGKKYSLLIAEQIRRHNNHPIKTTVNSFHGIIGRNKGMLALFDSIRQIGQTEDPVLIQGESGVGKELVALAIHRESERSGKNFVPVNCAALPEGLIESELFGHVKGGFTGANYNKKGRFGIADGGTIFLDEIGDLKPDIQAKFLRVLENGQFEPVGSDRSVNVDVRVISATNKALEKEIEMGRFRQDLYYRLCVMPIAVPPLRHRKDDMPLLADFFLEQCHKSLGKGNVQISPETLRLLKGHRWPGNVRELKNAIKYSAIKSTGDIIDPKHLPSNIQNNTIKSVTRRRRKSKLDADMVREALEKAGGNKSWAAERLGVSRSTLYRFLENSDE